MYAVSFDMVVKDLKEHFGEPYNNAYYEIQKIMEQHGFSWIQGSTYVTENHDMGNLFLLMQKLSKIDWFRNSVRDIRGYRIEDWSNFTQIVKNG